MKNIKYILYYDSPIVNGENRNCAMSAIRKANYIIGALNDIGYRVEIISPNWGNCGNKFLASKRESLDGINNIHYLTSVSLKGKIGQFCSYIFSMICLLFELIIKCERDETILVYHTQAFSSPVYYAKKLKNFKVCLEVEEVYYKTFKLKHDNRKSEDRIIKNADGYIIANDYLANVIDTEKKPSVILYGEYNILKLDYKDNGEKIRLVYTGMIDENQRDAFNAIELCKHLSSSYTLNIAGTGSEESIHRILETIKLHNDRYPCIVSYDGTFAGKEFDEYVSKFDVGLNIRATTEGYDLYSFPSKILMYLSHGLDVFTTPIRCVVNSKIAPFVNIASTYDNFVKMGKELSATELSNKIKTHDLIEALDGDFKNSLQLIIKKI